jgi:hypothetical protein
VATVTLRSGQIFHLQEDELRSVLADLEEPTPQPRSKFAPQSVAALQVFLRPRNGAEETFVCAYSHDNEGSPRCHLVRRIGRHSTVRPRLRFRKPLGRG